MPGRRRGTYSQAARVVRLIDDLAAHRYGRTIPDLAADHGVSERQLRRDLHAIEEAGYTLEPTVLGDRAGVRLPLGQRAAVRLSLRERYTLLAVRRVFDVLDGTPLKEDVESIFRKVASSLPTEEQGELARFGERFVYLPDGGTKRYRGKEDILDALLTAVLRRGCIRARYRSAKGKTSDMVLEPYALVLYKLGLYAIAARRREDGEETGRPFVYAVERFLDAQFQRGTRFEVPADFSIDTYFQGSFGIFSGDGAERVEIEFEPAAAPFVLARTWHPSERVSQLAGGRLRLRMEVSDLTQVVPWVASWGPLARAVAPPALVERVAETHRAAAARYR